MQKVTFIGVLLKFELNFIQSIATRFCNRYGQKFIQNYSVGKKVIMSHTIYTEQKKKKRNNRPPRIFEFMGKTLIISGLLLYDSNSWDIRLYHAKN